MARRKSSKKTKIALVAIMIMFLSTSLASVVLYYGDNSGQNRFSVRTSQGTYDFELQADQQGNAFYQVTGPHEFISYFPPDQIFLNITEPAKSILRQNSVFYMTFDPNAQDLTYVDFLRFQLSQNKPPSVTLQDGITQQHENYQLPVITCQNATAVPVVSLVESNTTSVYAQGNCVIVNYAQPDILRVRDSLIYLLHDMEVG